MCCLKHAQCYRSDFLATCSASSLSIYITVMYAVVALQQPDMLNPSYRSSVWRTKCSKLCRNRASLACGQSAVSGQSELLPAAFIWPVPSLKSARGWRARRLGPRRFSSAKDPLVESKAQDIQCDGYRQGSSAARGGELPQGGSVVASCAAMLAQSSEQPGNTGRNTLQQYSSGVYQWQFQPR